MHHTMADGGYDHFIDGVMSRRRPHQVDVIAIGKQTAVALFGGSGKRAWTAPGLNDDIVGHAGRIVIGKRHDTEQLEQDLVAAWSSVGHYVALLNSMLGHPFSC